MFWYLVIQTTLLIRTGLGTGLFALARFYCTRDISNYVTNSFTINVLIEAPFLSLVHNIDADVNVNVAS